MFTSYDKALAALVVAGASLLNLSGVTHLSPETVSNANAALSLIAPVLVWLIPNKKNT